MTELPTFDWITEPQEVPAALRKLKPDQDVVCVICRDPRRRSPLTHVATAQEHIAEIESLMSRQAMGRYTILEVAKILAKENQEKHLDEMNILLLLKEAVEDKKLTVTHPDAGGGPIARDARPEPYYHWVSPDSVNALLKEWKVDYSFAWPRPWRTEGTATPAPAPMVTEQAETKEQRQARRYQQGVDAGLAMPTNDYTPMPRGIGALAKKEKPKAIKRQSYVEDVKAHINRTFMH